MSVTSAGRVVLTLATDIAEWVSGLSEAAARAKAAAKAVETTWADAGQSLEQVGARLGKAGSVMSAAILLPLLGLGAAVAKTAIDVADTEGRVSGSFGDMTDAAVTWSRGLSASLGLNQFELRSQAATIMALSTTMGLGRDAAFDMATGVTALAQDMAEFRQIPVEDALEKIASGLRGQVRQLKEFGIQLDEASVKAEAHRLGLLKVGASLTEATAMQARWSLILQQTALDQGAVADSLEDPDRQLQRLTDALHEGWQEIAIAFLPIVKDLMRVAIDLSPAIKRAVEWFASLSIETKRTGVAIAGVVAVLGPALIVIGKLVSVGGGLVTALSGIGVGAGVGGGLLAFLANPLVLGAAASIGLIALSVWKLRDALAQMNASITRDTSVRLLPHVAEQQQALRDGLVQIGKTAAQEALGTIKVKTAEAASIDTVRDAYAAQEQAAKKASKASDDKVAKDLKEAAIWALKYMESVEAATVPHRDLDRALTGVGAQLGDFNESVIQTSRGFERLTTLGSGARGMLDVLGNEVRTSTEPALDDLLGTVEDMGPTLAQLGADEIPAATDGLRDLARAFDTLADVAGDRFGGVLQVIGEVIASLELATQAGETFRQGLQAWSGARTNGQRIAAGASMAAGAITAAGAIQQSTSGESRWGNVGRGAASGAAAGNAIVPGYGAIVGALAGAIAGALRNPEAKVNKLRQSLIDTFDSSTTAKDGLANLNREAQRAGVSLDAILRAKNTAQFQAAWDEVQEAIARHNDKLEEARALVESLGTSFGSIMGGAVMETAQDLGDLGVIAVASVSAALEAGHTLADAIGMNHDGLARLRQAYVDLGLPIEDAFLNELLLQDAIVSGNPQLLQAIGGLGASMEAMSRLGLLTVETFGAMQRTGLRMYEKLQEEAAKAGGGTKDALLPMQEYLREAEARAKELGVPLDENLQSLIDQSKELGIWRERGKSANEMLLDGLDKLVDKMDEFLDRILRSGSALRDLSVPDLPSPVPSSGGPEDLLQGRRTGAPVGLYYEDARASVGGRGGTAVIEINGRAIAEVVVPEMSGVVHRYGLGR